MVERVKFTAVVSDSEWADRESVILEGMIVGGSFDPNEIGGDPTNRGVRG